MAEDARFARLVGLACHDINTPLTVVAGFAATLAKSELPEREARYVAMVADAAAQIRALVGELGLVARIESGRFEPHLTPVDSLELARGAAAELDAGRVEVSGAGAPVRLLADEARRALSQLARAASRHGGHDSVRLAVAGADLELGPVTPTSAPVLLGEQPLDFSAAAAAALLTALGSRLAVEGEHLRISLPPA